MSRWFGWVFVTFYYYTDDVTLSYFKLYRFFPLSHFLFTIYKRYTLLLCAIHKET